MYYLIFQVFFFIVLLYYIYFKKKNIFQSYILLIWLVSSLFSVFFCAFYNPDNIDYRSVVFFDVSFLLCLLSISKLNTSNIRIEVESVDNYYYFLLFLGLISLFPFIENSIHVVQTYFSENSDAVLKMYNDKMDVNIDQTNLTTWLSRPSKIFNSISCRFVQLSYVLFFIVLCNRRVNIKRILMCSLSILNPLMYGVAKSGRGAVVFAVLYIIFLFLLFKDQFRIEIKSKIRILFVSVFGFFAFIVILLSIIRQSNSLSDNTMLTSVSLYLGEGQVRFFDQMWNIKQNTMGDNSFSFFKSILVEHTATNFLERRELWTIDKTGVDPRFFYTFIGDIYSDLGKISIFLYFILFVYLRKVLNRKNVGICVFFLISVFGYVLVNGFTIYPFKIFDLSLNVFTCLIVLWLLSKFKFNRRYIR